ncbi:MAG: hypothetical protein J7L90_02475 [Dehalococcoidia bacterium]|nr:hypothetical protein [Dehalococcoidia bacterium]
MNTLDKLQILGPAAEYDTCNDCESKNALTGQATQFVVVTASESDRGLLY